MNRMKLQFLGVLALGALIGQFIWLAASAPSLTAQEASKAKEKSKAASPAAAGQGYHPAERAALDKATQAFVEAYSQGDIDRVAGHLAEGAELTSNDAPPLRGRDAIRQALTDYFAENSPKQFTREIESVRFTSKHSAVEDGNLKVAVGGGAAKNMRYSLRLVEEDGQWLITAIEEWPSDVGDLMDMEWLIGTWEAKRADAEMRATYEWFGEKSFIRSTMTFRQQDLTFTTMQIIGIDPRTDELRVWVFETNGGFAEGTCTREGNNWIFETQGVLTDGDAVSATNILVRVNGDTTTWQPVNLTVGDQEIDDVAPIKLSRVKSAK